MDGLIAFLFLIAAIWFFFRAFGGSGGPVRRDVWRALARRFEGAVDKSRWRGASGVRFRYAGSDVFVRQSARGRTVATDAWFDWPDSDLRLHIVSSSTSISSESVRGLRVFENPRDPFHWRFRVFANHTDRADGLLGETVKWQIEQLRQHFPNRGVEIRVANGRLLVRKRVLFHQLSALERFTKDAVRLYDQLLVSQADGIEIIATGTEPSGVIDCQICGQPIASDLVRCRRCGTPHHRECWEYNGACSVFGCLETVCVPARDGSIPG
ncbi:MAG: hypothetical protein FJ297_02405 [Planctomycetes bacterium]|nr:hypothetical protein [Planctomycetota bacterium]